MTYTFIPARWHGGSQSSIDRIVIHGTVSPTVVGGAKSVANYFQVTGRPSSAHYVVDPGAIVQCVPDNVVAYHDGTNYNSIGIELCDWVDGLAARWNDQAHVDMLTRAAMLIATLSFQYKVPIEKINATQIRAGERGVCGHVDMRDAYPSRTTHYDPGVGFPWQALLTMAKGGNGDMWPDKLLDYGANKDSPPLTDSTVLMSWTVAKVRWIDERTARMEASLGAIANTQKAILAALADKETPSV